jgi:NAD(P)-dependent dehydrogenase (short-subunit alcohol dehydrogenase family)
MNLLEELDRNRRPLDEVADGVSIDHRAASILAQHRPFSRFRLSKSRNGLPRLALHSALSGRREVPLSSRARSDRDAGRVSRSVFVTGGSRGLGLEIARAHLLRGDRVGLLARGREGLEAAARSLDVGPGRVELYSADVRDAAAVGEAIGAFSREAGPIRRLYANAGAIERSTGASAFDRGVFETNIYGAVNAVEGWLATSPPAGSSVGIISSFSAFRGLPHLPAYGASKAAVTVYAESLRGQLRASGLRVTTAFLGYLDSELASSRKPSMFVTPCATAARVVVEAVDRGASRTAYPPIVRAAVFATRCLPDALYDRLVARRYRKTAP